MAAGKCNRCAAHTCYNGFCQSANNSKHCEETYVANLAASLKLSAYLSRSSSLHPGKIGKLSAILPAGHFRRCPALEAAVDAQQRCCRPLTGIWYGGGSQHAGRLSGSRLSTLDSRLTLRRCQSGTTDYMLDRTRSSISRYSCEYRVPAVPSPVQLCCSCTTAVL